MSHMIKIYSIFADQMHLIISFIVIIKLTSHIIVTSDFYLNHFMIFCVISSLYRNQSESFFVFISSLINQNNFSLSDEFSNSDESQLELIEWQIFETLSNAFLFTNVSKNNLISLQLIAFNKLFKIVYFTELFFNLTNNIAEYEISDSSRQDFIINNIIAVKNICFHSLIVKT